VFSARSCNGIAACSLSAGGIDRGAEAGNGGMMADSKAKSKETKRRKAVNPITAKNAGAKTSPRAKKPPVKKSELDMIYDAIDLSGPDDQQVNGEDCLRTKMNRLIEKRSSALAKRLGQKAEEGNVTSAKLILALVSKNKPTKRPSSKRLQSWVGNYESDSDLLKLEEAQTKDGGV
jgi:hypothetical protein